MKSHAVAYTFAFLPTPKPR